MTTLQEKKIKDIRKLAVDWYGAYSSWIKSMYSNEEARVQSINASNSIREAHRDAVRLWLTTKGMDDVFVRSELRVRTNNYQSPSGARLIPGMTSVFTAQWVDKVSVMEDGSIKSHKARRDSRFLHPFEQEFAKFIKELNEKLMEHIHATP